MRTRTILAAVAVCFIGLASSQAAQTYLNTGHQSIGPSGVYVRAQDGTHSPFVELSRTINTTLIIDPDNLEARYSGAVSAGTASLSYTTGTSAQQVDTIIQFPNPPQPVYVDGSSTITLTLATEAFTFDTGVRDIEWNGSGYVLGALTQPLASFNGTISLTMSVTSGGQTATTTANWAFIGYFASTGLLDLTNYPNSAALLASTFLPGIEGGASVSTPNGFTANFEVIPEPSAAGLAALGAAFLFRRRMNKG